MKEGPLERHKGRAVQGEGEILRRVPEIILVVDTPSGTAFGNMNR